jgi:hypothetical protein
MSSEFDDLFDNIGPLAEVDPITMLAVLQSTHMPIPDFAAAGPVEFQFEDQSSQTAFSLFTVSNDAPFQPFGRATIEEIPDSVPRETSSTEIVPFENVPVTATQEDGPKKR